MIGAAAPEQRGTMATRKQIKLGGKAKDVVTGFTGVVTCIAEYLTGCTQVLLTPQKLNKDGTRPSEEWFDIERIQLLASGVKLPKSPTGGPQPHPARRETPRR